MLSDRMRIHLSVATPTSIRPMIMVTWLPCCSVITGPYSATQAERVRAMLAKVILPEDNVALR